MKVTMYNITNIHILLYSNSINKQFVILCFHIHWIILCYKYWSSLFKIFAMLCICLLLNNITDSMFDKMAFPNMEISRTPSNSPIIYRIRNSSSLFSSLANMILYTSTGTCKYRLYRFIFGSTGETWSRLQMCNRKSNKNILILSCMNTSQN